MRLPCFAALALGLPLAAMAAEVAGPNWELTDKRTLTVTFPTKPPVAIENDTAQVEDMIAHLGEYRAAMVPEVPPEFPQGQSVDAIRNPAWMLENESRGDVVIHIRDPRYGWLHYLLPRQEAAKMAGLLQALSMKPLSESKP